MRQGQPDQQAKAPLLGTAPNPLPSEEKEWRYRSIVNAASDGLIISDLETGLVVEANPAACTMHGYIRENFIGRPVTAFIHPDSQHEFNECIQSVQSGTFAKRIQHICRDGSTFFAEWHGTMFIYRGRPCLLGIVHDVTEQVRVEQSLSQQVETLAYEQATLLDISYSLASTLKLQPDLLLDQLRKVIGYEQGAFFALEDSALVTQAIYGISRPENTPIHIRLNTPEETLATLLNEHRPTRIADIWSDDPQAQFLHSLLDSDAAVLLEGMQSWMWAPLAVRGRIIGAIGLARSTKDFFTAHQADLALSVANKAAITMINAELYGHAQAIAVLEERQRLARNLHDAINQSLFSAGLIAEVLPHLWEQDQEDARQSLEDLRRLTRGAQAEMRALLAELRPSTLTDSDLGDLLNLLGNAHSGRTNLPVSVTVTGEFILPPNVQVAFYRVCQEALYNIAKHAKASRVEINLKQEDKLIKLSIRDDGQGFDPAQKISGHYGLSMMQERADAAGASLSIASAPGRGTELTIGWAAPQTQVHEF